MTPCSAVTTTDSGAAVAAATGSGSIGRGEGGGKSGADRLSLLRAYKTVKLCYQPCNCQAKADDFRLWTERDTDTSGDTLPPWGLPRAFWARYLRMIAAAALDMN